jgi:hypothetical protein
MSGGSGHGDNGGTRVAVAVPQEAAGFPTQLHLDVAEEREKAGPIDLFESEVGSTRIDNRPTRDTVRAAQGQGSEDRTILVNGNDLVVVRSIGLDFDTCFPESSQRVLVAKAGFDVTVSKPIRNLVGERSQLGSRRGDQCQFHTHSIGSHGRPRYGARP